MPSSGKLVWVQGVGAKKMLCQSKITEKYNYNFLQYQDFALN